MSSGRLLIAVGLVLVLILDLHVALRAVACLVWFAMGRFELVRIERGFDSCTAIRLSTDGAVSICNNELEWRPATLQTGSVVLRNFAWLRLQTADGSKTVELLRGNARHGDQWRRLQVIWRHIGAAG